MANKAHELRVERWIDGAGNDRAPVTLDELESEDSLLNPHSSAKTDSPLGSEKFIETLESLTGRPLKCQMPGPKPFT
jgi:hypothetical protein